MILKAGSKIAISLGNFNIYWYGIIMSASILIASWLSYVLLKKEKNITVDDFTDFALWLVIGGVLGARLYYVLFNFGYYSSNIIEIIQLYKGGLSIHGGLLGGALAYFLYTSKHTEFKGSIDIIAVCIPLAQSIGRWGNFLNNEAFGKPSDFALKLYIPENMRPLEFINENYFHPTFLYESIINLFIFITLLILYKNCRAKLNGYFPYIYLGMYSIARFIIEPIRIDSIYYVLNMPLAQFISLVIFVFSLGMILYKSQKIS